MELKIYNAKGEETDRVAVLNDEVFAVEPNDNAIYLDVKQYMANKRQGTHKSKERSEIAHSTRKLKRQKGTGGARCGDLKSPVFVGGGRVFGPRPRDYSFKLNKKVKNLARKSALSYKAKDTSIIVLEDLNFAEPKTKEFIQLVKNLNLTDKKNVFVVENVGKNLLLSARNLPKSSITSVSELNTYKILNAQSLIITESSVAAINNI
ncbi:MAG TPA: 50S ribosomal protein L4 [Porphyromonadaceae bacterium]|nr:50S ribosomal protein L4 [Porphyromonadaceae bacterium]